MDKESVERQSQAVLLKVLNVKCKQISFIFVQKFAFDISICKRSILYPWVNA